MRAPRAVRCGPVWTNQPSSIRFLFVNLEGTAEGSVSGGGKKQRGRRAAQSTSRRTVRALGRRRPYRQPLETSVRRKMRTFARARVVCGQPNLPMSRLKGQPRRGSPWSSSQWRLNHNNPRRTPVLSSKRVHLLDNTERISGTQGVGCLTRKS